MTESNDKAAYITNRLLRDVCGIITPYPRCNYENSYNQLLSSVVPTINSYPRRTNFFDIPFYFEWEDTKQQVIDAYTSLLETMPFPEDSLPVLTGWFTLTYLIMLRYKLVPQICSRIGCCFYAVSSSMRCWENI